MTNPVPNPDELNQLKQELAAMRKQMDDLRAQVKKMTRHFIVQEQDLENNFPEVVMIRCTNLTVFHRRDNKHEEQMRLTGGDEGPFITLYGRDEKGRVELSAQNDGAQLLLFSKDNALAFQVKAEESSNRGFVGVFESGKPRAGVKATESGGVVTVAHDDGRPRAFLAADAQGGSVHILSGETQAGTVSLQTTPDGGAIHIHDCSGTRQAIVAASPAGGQLVLNNDLGIQRVYLGSVQDSAALMLNWGGTDAVILGAFDYGGNLILNDAAGNSVAELPDRE